MFTIPVITAADFGPLIPAILLLVGAIIVLLSEVFLSTASRSYQSVLTALFGTAAAVIAVGAVGEAPRKVFLGFAVSDSFSSLITAVICMGLVLAALVARGYLHDRHSERGEFYALMMFGAAGMSLLSVSNELITLFINLEVLSIATYALTAYLRRGARSTEAGFKYFILGAFSSAILLYGAALLYGATGTTHLSEMAGPLAEAFQSSRALVYAGVFLVGTGLAFKVAAVPFHMWTPDVYEGAPTPVTAFMSAGVKAAAFAALVRVFLSFSPGMPDAPLLELFATLSLLTMIVGNLLAIPQRNVKRMLAYSSIAHAGYVLAGVAALFATGAGEAGFRVIGSMEMHNAANAAVRSDALKGILFYLLAYTVTGVGAFGLISALERREDEDRGTAWDLERFAGLAQRKPGWALAMAVFMLSLGGIPPTIGFIGKLYIFRAAIDAGMTGLVVVGVLTSAASVYFYLRVVVYMYMRPAADGAVTHNTHWSTETALVLSTAAVVILGVLPGPVTGWLAMGGSLFGQ